MGEFSERTKQSLRDSAARGEMVRVTVEQIERALPLEYRNGAKTLVKNLGPLYRRSEDRDRE
jgi:hypothetical protein